MFFECGDFWDINEISQLYEQQTQEAFRRQVKELSFEGVGARSVQIQAFHTDTQRIRQKQRCTDTFINTNILPGTQPCL